MVIANLLGAGVACRRLLRQSHSQLCAVSLPKGIQPGLRARDDGVQENGDEQAVRELLAAVAGTLGGIVTVVTLLGVLGWGVLTALFGWGWFWDWLHGGPGGEVRAGQSDAQDHLPYLWFITFTAMAGPFSTTFGRFAVSSFTPVFLNITMIGAAWVDSALDGAPEISWRSVSSSAVWSSFLFQYPFCASSTCWSGLGGVGTILGGEDPHPDDPGPVGVSVSQINLLINTMLASFLATGAISYLYYSDRLLEFPLGLFAVAISTVILPALA